MRSGTFVPLRPLIEKAGSVAAVVVALPMTRDSLYYSQPPWCGLLVIWALEGGW